MNNYEYIIAGLPFLSQDGREAPDTEDIIGDIRSQLVARDAAILDFLLDSFRPEKLDGCFYYDASHSRNRFIREYCALDLNVRNAKVAYLNRSLGRQEGTDIVVPSPAISEDGSGPELPDAEYTCDADSFPQKAEVEAILENSDILARERGLDDFYWKAADQITVLDVFDLDLILAFVVKLKLVERWLRLDEATGRELFRKLVKEIKENTKI